MMHISNMSSHKNVLVLCNVFVVMRIISKYERRLRLITGVSAFLVPVLLFVTLVVSSVLYPNFSWQNMAISDLTEPTSPVAGLFDALVSITINVALLTHIGVFSISNKTGKIGSVISIISLMSGFIVLIYPISSLLHLLFALIFFLGIPIGSAIQIVDTEVNERFLILFLIAIPLEVWAIQYFNGLAIPEIIILFPPVIVTPLFGAILLRI